MGACVASSGVDAASSACWPRRVVQARLQAGQAFVATLGCELALFEGVEVALERLFGARDLGVDRVEPLFKCRPKGSSKRSMGWHGTGAAPDRGGRLWLLRSREPHRHRHLEAGVCAIPLGESLECVADPPPPRRLLPPDYLGCADAAADAPLPQLVD